MPHRIVFDFDGPIFDGRLASQTALEATTREFAARFGVPDLAATRPLLPPRALIALLYPDLDAADRQVVRSAYEEKLHAAERGTGVRAEVRETLDTLLAAGCQMMLFSGRPAGELKGLLADLGLSRYFAPPLDGETAAKPSGDYLKRIAASFGLEADGIVFVGDSDQDWQAARDAGVAYYHATWTGEPSAGAGPGAALKLTSIRDLAAVFAAPNLAVDGGADPMEELRRAVEEGRFCFYAGAGVSVPSGVGDWQRHYLPVLEKLGAGHMRGDDLPEVLQLLAANPMRAKRVYDAFRDSFEPHQSNPNPYHYAMLRSYAERIWTSNYDTLFEAANTIGQFGRRIVRSDADLLESFRSQHVVIKMNGDFETARFHESLEWGLVFLQEQFDRAERARPEIWRLFEDDYRSRTILFVGVSFKDPVLRRIVAVARQKVTNTRYNHFFLARREKDAAAWAKQAMFAENLRRSFIVTLFKDDTAQIRELVEKVAVFAHRPIVGFSGDVGQVTDAAAMAATVPEGLAMTAADVERVCAGLAEELARRRFRVTSGHAPFVGIPAVNAAFAVDPGRARFYLRKLGRTTYQRTAPAIVVPGEGYREMRRRFIHELSLLVAVAGRPQGEQRSGVLEEIEMALELGIPALLLPQAGGVVGGYLAEFAARAERAYPDVRLRDALKAVQGRVNAVSAADLPAFARGELPVLLEGLIAVAMGAGAPWGNATARIASLRW